jgi:hypothetical protein
MAVTSFDCKARLATPKDVDAIVAFYEQHRTPAVYLRKREEIEDSVKNDLFFLVENNKNQIIAASGVFILNKGEELQECIVNGNRNERARVAELGSVLRWPEGLPLNKQYKGVWHPFLFSVPMILLFDRMRREGGLHVDTLVCDVQSELFSTKQRLQGQVELTPLQWTGVEPGKDLIRAFKDTVRSDDPYINNPKEFFRGWVGNLPKVAKYLILTAKKGLTNRNKEALSIDLRTLIERWTQDIDISSGKRYTVLGLLADRDNEKRILQNYRVGWGEFSRNIDYFAPAKGKPLNGLYQLSLDEVAKFKSTARSLTVSSGNNHGEPEASGTRPDKRTADISVRDLHHA